MEGWRRFVVPTLGLNGKLCIKWGELYVHMVSNYVRVDKEPLVMHHDLEDAQDEAIEIARFLGQGLTIYKTEVVFEVEP